MEHYNIFIVGIVVGIMFGAFIGMVGASVCVIRKESEKRALKQICYKNLTKK